jgi:glutathione S-transferase
VPLYEEPGLTLVQSGAIARHLGKKLGYAGASDHEAALIDAAYEGVSDIVNRFVAVLGLPAEQAKTETERLMKEYLPLQLGYLDKLLEKNGNNGFLVGGQVRVVSCVVCRASCVVRRACAVSRTCAVTYRGSGPPVELRGRGAVHDAAERLPEAWRGLAGRAVSRAQGLPRRHPEQGPHQALPGHRPLRHLRSRAEQCQHLFV